MTNEERFAKFKFFWKELDKWDGKPTADLIPLLQRIGERQDLSNEEIFVINLAADELEELCGTKIIRTAR